MRSPMMPFWISLVPPAIDAARDHSNPRAHRPPSTAAGRPPTAARRRRGARRRSRRGAGSSRSRTASPGSTRDRWARRGRGASGSGRCAAGRSRRPSTSGPAAGAPGGPRRGRLASARRQSRSRATSCRTCSFHTKLVPRSLARVVPGHLPSPAFSSPIRFSAGTSTPSRKTSLNSDSPVIWRRGRTSTPSACRGMASIEMPRCFGASGIGAHQGDPVVGELRVRRPHLLAGHDVGVAAASRPAWTGRPGRCPRRAR